MEVLLPVALLPDLPHMPDVGDGLRGAWRKQSDIFCSLHPVGTEHEFTAQLHFEKIFSVFDYSNSKRTSFTVHTRHMYMLCTENYSSLQVMLKIYFVVVTACMSWLVQITSAPLCL